MSRGSSAIRARALVDAQARRGLLTVVRRVFKRSARGIRACAGALRSAAGDPALGWALNGLGLVRYGAADYDAAHALGGRVHALAERHDDPGLRIAAANLLGLPCASHAEHAKAIGWLQLGVGVCEALPAPPSHDRFFVDPGVSMGGHLGVHLLPLGLIDRARAHAERALARALRLQSTREAGG